MKAICLHDDEITELYNLIYARKDAILHYAINSNLNFDELRALFSALEKIENEFTEGEKNDVL